jgi:hypothetical protein
MDETDGECTSRMLRVSIDEDLSYSNCCDRDVTNSSGYVQAVEKNVGRPLDATDDCVVLASSVTPNIILGFILSSTGNMNLYFTKSGGT